MILRDLKLDILLGKQNHIVDKFNEITKDLKVIKTDVCNNQGQEFIFYNENREWIFYQDLKNEYFWCNYYLYWTIFEVKFNLEHTQIQDITKYLVEETLKVKVVTPYPDTPISFQMVEDALKLKVGTADSYRDLTNLVVEDT